MKRIGRLFTNYLSRRSTRLVLAAVALLIAALALTWVYYQPVRAEVDYTACDISYGEVVGEWSGSEDSEWDRSGVHYQVRRFSLQAHAPDVARPNTIEAVPSRLSTGGGDGCIEEFDETIDTTAEFYRYNGARTQAIRFGVPDLGDTNTGGRFFRPISRAESRADLSVPVYATHPTAAAVWVDDGGSAEILIEAEATPLWCINGSDCHDIIDHEAAPYPAKGQGYQFVTDNCPAAISCNAEWYDATILSRLTTAEATPVAPFDLRLSAVSTWAPTIGTEMLLVFAYPTEVELDVALNAESDTFDPGASFDLTAHISKVGPLVTEGQLQLETAEQPADSPASTRVLTATELATLNQTDVLKLTFPVTIAPTAERGACYQLQLALTGVTENRSITGFDYCITPPDPEPTSPASLATHFTYSVNTRGETESDLSQFKAQAAATLNDARGWAQAGVSTTAVSSGGDFILWLAAPDTMTSFSSACSAEYSCRVGQNVVINDARWQNATSAWNSAGGSLRDYRHMVINHEVGHFLGHGHYGCPAPGARAPVMQQQSIDLDGCKFNPWPLPFELAAI
ncbi:MAG: DUF3152 domain-containing protein [Candidatus Saccharimonadales bacterium]